MPSYVCKQTKKEKKKRDNSSMPKKTISSFLKNYLDFIGCMLILFNQSRIEAQILTAFIHSGTTGFFS